jgi:hypothetical protein
LINFHHTIPTNVALAPFLLQPPLLELEIHILWEPVGVCAQEAAKAPQRTGSCHKMLVCMQHNVGISKENPFYNLDVFISLNIDDSQLYIQGVSLGIDIGM